MHASFNLGKAFFSSGPAAFIALISQAATSRLPNVLHPASACDSCPPLILFQRVSASPSYRRSMKSSFACETALQALSNFFGMSFSSGNTAIASIAFAWASAASSSAFFLAARSSRFFLTRSATILSCSDCSSAAGSLASGWSQPAIGDRSRPENSASRRGLGSEIGVDIGADHATAREREGRCQRAPGSSRPCELQLVAGPRGNRAFHAAARGFGGF